MNISSNSTLIASSNSIYEDDLREDAKEWKETKARLESYLPRYRALWLAYHQEKHDVNNEDMLVEEKVNDAYEADDEMVICCDKQKCSCGIFTFVPQGLLEIEIKNESQDNPEVLSEPEWEEHNKSDESSETSSSDDTYSSGDSTCVPFNVSWLPSPTGSPTTDCDNKIDIAPQQLQDTEKIDLLELVNSSLSDASDDKENNYTSNHLGFRQPEIIVIDSDEEIITISETSRHVPAGAKSKNKSIDQNKNKMNAAQHSLRSSRDSGCRENEFKSETRNCADTGTKRRRRLVIESSDEESIHSRSRGVLNVTSKKTSEGSQTVFDSDDIRHGDGSERRVDDLLGKIKSLTLRNEIDSESDIEVFRSMKRTSSGVYFDLVDSDDDIEEGKSMGTTSGDEDARKEAVGKGPTRKNETKIRRNSFIVDSDDDERDDCSDSDDTDYPVEVRHSKDSKLNERDKMTKSAFRRSREQLTQTLFAEFDKKVFDGKLSASTTVVWSNKLRTTAGLTRLKALRQGKEIISRSAVVELSTKVLEDSQRLRATLMHELCHAAQWLEDGVSKPPHGGVFKKWARMATRRMPHIPVTVKHDYEISFKYTWKCVQCNGLLKRHSRSVNVEKHVCGRCRGQLVEVEADGRSAVKSKRLPSAYNQFIKDNSSKVRSQLEKSQSEKVTQAQVMKQCAQLWKEKSNP